jgi:hypothetical protein
MSVEDGQTVTVRILNSSNIAQDVLTTVVSGSVWSVNVTSAQAQGLAAGSYTVTADVSNAAGTAAPEASDAITVNPAAEPASLAGTVLTVSGGEDSAIPLTIVATPSDNDDLLSINISGVPAGATLSAGTLNGDGSYTLAPAQLSGLTLNAGESGGSLNVVVTSSEGGSSAVSSASIAVNVTPVAEAPSLAGTIQMVSGSENSAIPLTIVATPADSDDLLSINISGVPAGATLSSGTLNADGSYTLTPAQLSGLTYDSGATGTVLRVVATNTEGASIATASVNIAVPINALFDFVYTYPDGKDYYEGTVADNGAFGYQSGQVITLPGGGQYVITGSEPGTGNAPGAVFVADYSHNGIGQASPEPQQTASGQADGTAGLGSEADALLGTDGLPHPFSPTVEASFPVNQQYGFVYDYADGAGYYTGTVSDNGGFGYAAVAASATPFIFTVNPSTGAIAGHYLVFAEGQTSDPSGTVRLSSYVDGASGAVFSLGGGAAGNSGLGNESGSFLVGGSAFTFSDTQELVDPPAPPLSPLLFQRADGTILLDTVSGGQVAPPQIIGQLDAGWHFAGVGDFAGSGANDLLWQSDSGTLMVFDIANNQVTGMPVIGQIGAEWHLDGIGDFDGNGSSDLLWQRTDGSLMIFDIDHNQMTAMPMIGQIGAEWHFAGVGDFNGDGTSDMLWQSGAGALMVFNVNGNQVTSTPMLGQVGSEWQLAGIGDFNQDGSSDLLWRSGDGTLMINDIVNDRVVNSVTAGQIGPEWHLLGFGDVNGDGTIDLLFRNDAGTSQIDGIVNNRIVSSQIVGQIGTEWHSFS